MKFCIAKLKSKEKNCNQGLSSGVDRLIIVGETEKNDGVRNNYVALLVVVWIAEMSGSVAEWSKALV